MATNILSSAEMQEKLAEHGRKDVVSHDEFVEALRLWVSAKEANEALTRQELAAMAAFDRLDALRKGLIISQAIYYRTHQRADVAPGVLALITILSDNDSGTCSLGQAAMGEVLGRTRTAIAEAVSKLKELKLISSDRGRAGSSPIIPRVVSVQYNHVVWVVDTLRQNAAAKGNKLPKHVPSTGHVEPSNMSRKADMLPKHVPSSRHVEPTCPVDGTCLEEAVNQHVPSTGHKFTKEKEKKQSAGACASARSEAPTDSQAKTAPVNNAAAQASSSPAETLQQRQERWRLALVAQAIPLESALSAEHAERWLGLIPGWGLPADQQASTSVDASFAVNMLKNVVSCRGKGFDLDVIRDAVEMTLLDMEGKKFDGQTDKTRTGATAAKRYFEKVFVSSLSSIDAGRHQHEATRAVIDEAARIKVEVERQAGEKRLAALDGAIQRGVAAKAKNSQQPTPANEASSKEEQFGGMPRSGAVTALAGYLKHKRWTSNMQAAFGAAPYTANCRIPSDIIADAVALAGTT